MRVIIAEDEKLNGRGLLPDRLGRAGYDVTNMADGEAACVALLSATVPTIAVLAQGRPRKGSVPIFGYCKCIRDDGNYWQQIEVNFVRHTGTRFSHGVCPKCEDEQLAGFNKVAVAVVLDKYNILQLKYLSSVPIR